MDLQMAYTLQVSRSLNPYNLIPKDRGYHFYTDGNLSYFVYFDKVQIIFKKLQI